MCTRHPLNQPGFPLQPVPVQACWASRPMPGPWVMFTALHPECSNIPLAEDSTMKSVNSGKLCATQSKIPTDSHGGPCYCPSLKLHKSRHTLLQEVLRHCPFDFCYACTLGWRMVELYDLVIHVLVNVDNGCLVPASGTQHHRHNMSCTLQNLPGIDHSASTSGQPYGQKVYQV